MKNHLKAVASPKTWIINRKKNIFTLRPNPGGHSFEAGLALGVIMRDNLKLASAMNEVKKILNNKEVLVDGKRRKDHRYLVGLFDVLSIPEISKNYRLIIDNKGRLIVIDIPKEESSIKLSKVVGKTVLKGNKFQFNLHDGKNIVSDQKAKVGDTFVLSLPKLEIRKIIPLKEGVQVFLTKGKHTGDLGVLKEIKGNIAVYSVKDNEVETARSYIFVVGEKKNEIKLGR